MTTDPFIEAACESAASKYRGDWDAFQREPVDDWGYSEAERRAHIAGWKAARTHLAAQEPTDAEVEAAAREAVPALLDALTRAEAQSDIRGRAVAIYQQRAREAEAERDEWRQAALDERGAALDLLEQIKARDKQIQAVREPHQKDGHDPDACGEPDCFASCIEDGMEWPCDTILALDGVE